MRIVLAALALVGVVVLLSAGWSVIGFIAAIVGAIVVGVAQSF